MDSTPLIVIFLLLLVTSIYSGGEIQVCSEEPPLSDCVDINKALQDLVSSTKIKLQPGVHVINRLALQINITNVVITGSSLSDSQSLPTVKCNDTNGLAFVGVQNLTLESVIVDGCGIRGQTYDTIVAALRVMFMNSLLDMYTSVILHSGVALFIGNCRNVSITSVTIRNTAGIGLVGINVLGLQVKNSTFENNTCGGLHLLYIDYQDKFSRENLVSISSSKFKKNSDCIDSNKLSSVFTENADRYNIRWGGGLTLLLSQLQYNVSVRIISSTFEQNGAKFGGGAYVALCNGVSEFQETPECEESTVLDSISFTKCTFEVNTAHKVSALAIRKENVNCRSDVKFRDLTFANNAIQDVFTESQINVGATVSLQAINVTLSGVVLFENNYGVALSAMLSSIHIMDEVTFKDNVGLDCGGGLKLIDSYLELHNNSALFFLKNKALVAGGGICMDHAIAELARRSFELDSYVSECYIHCATSNGLCENTLFNSTIVLQGNRAKSGDSIFGIDFSGTCSYLQNTKILHLEENVTISTNIGQIQLLDYPQIIMPGQKFYVILVAYDPANQPRSDVVFATITGRTDRPLLSTFNAAATIGEDNYWSLQDKNVPITVFGEQNKDVSISIISQSTLHFVTFTIHLTSCSLGYTYSEQNRSCECDQRLANISVFCDKDKVEFVPPHTKWFGPLYAQDNNDSATHYAEKNDNLVLQKCPLDYCKLNESTTPFDFDIQCAEGRTGLLCGVCKDNYSVTLGTGQCKQCSNYYVFLVIPFLLFGILLILATTKLGITISEGYVNSILFYCNVVNYLSVYIFSKETNWILIPAGLISITPKIGVCFFDGMNSLTFYISQYVFVLYLYILMVIVILLVHFSVVELKSPTKTFASLLLLCYGAVTDLSITTLAFVRIQTLNRDTYWRWYIDPTVPYFRGLHALISVLAIIVTVIYIIPTTIVTLFPQRLYNIRYVSRLKPLYDAIWAPFKPHFRWWFGFRLIARWVIIFIATFLHYTIPSNTFAMLIILVILTYLHTTFSPFQGIWQNWIDSFLLTNLILLMTGALYFEHDTITPGSGQSIYSGLLVGVAYITFIGMLIKYLFSRFFDVARKEKCIKLKKKRETESTLQLVSQESESSSGDDESLAEASPHLPRVEGELNVWQQESIDPNKEEMEMRQKVITFSEYREPLLEEGEAEMTAFATIKRKVKTNNK